MARMNGSARPATSVTGILDSVSDVIEGGRVAPRPNPELVARAKRRTYTGEYKQEILAEADAARGSGEIGAVLRRHGLYSSHLTKWRQERKSGMLEGLAAHKRGPKSKANLLTAENLAMDIRPNFLCDTTTSVVLHLRPCSSALSVQNLSSFFVEYCKSHCPADIPGTRWLDATFCSCNSAYEVGRPASEALCTACIFALIHPRYGR